MLRIWQQDFDEQTKGASFYQVDFAKLHNLYITPEFSFYLQKNIQPDNTYFTECKALVSKNLKRIKKHLGSEIALIDNKHIKKFFDNLMSYFDIEHFYILSIGKSWKTDSSSPNLIHTLQRFIRMITDLHLIYIYSDDKDEDSFNETREMLDQIINLLYDDFFKYSSKFLFESEKNPGNDIPDDFKDIIGAILVFLENFTKYRDHKAYIQTCAPDTDFESSMTSVLTEIPTSRSQMASGRELSTFRHEERGTSSVMLSTIKNSNNYESNLALQAKEILKGSKQLASTRRIEGLKYSKLTGSEFSTTGSLNDSHHLEVHPILSTPSETGSNKAAEYIKNSQNFARLLGDLKQYRELGGLKLIDTTEAFPKVQTNNQKIKSWANPRIKISKRNIESELLNLIDVEEGEEGLTFKLTESYRSLLEQKRMQKEEAERQAKLEQEMLAKIETKNSAEDNGSSDEELEENSSSDENNHWDKKKRKKLRKFRKEKETMLDAIDAPGSLENKLERDPDAATEINNYKFYTTLVEYQKPELEYLERTERIKEIPADILVEEEIFDFDYKVDPPNVRRKLFLEKIYGNLLVIVNDSLGKIQEEEINEKLSEVYVLPEIEGIKNNHTLKASVLQSIKTDLENHRIKQLIKTLSNKESVGYFYRQNIETIQETYTTTRRLNERANMLWGVIRSKMKVLLSLKKSNPNVQWKFNQMRNVRSIKFLYHYDQIIQNNICNYTYSNSQYKQIDCVGQVKRRKEIKLRCQKSKKIIFP